MEKYVGKIKEILKSKVLKNGIWLIILQIVNTIIPVITIPYITRILGASEYGVFSIALNWILYLQVLVEFGFGLNGARKVAMLKENNKKELNKIYNDIISSRIVLLIISFVVINIIALVSKFETKVYIGMLVLFTMIIGTTFQLTWLFQGKQDMKFITIINVIARIISFTLIFILVKTSNDLYLYCLLYSITMLISSIISNIIAYKKYGLKFKFSKNKDIKKEINDGKYLFASTAMAKIFNGFGITILGIVSTTTITGIYSAIFKLPYVLTMFFYPVTQAIYPHISSKFKKSYSSGIRTVKKLSLPIFLLFLIPSIIIVLFRNYIVEILFGSDYIGYSIIVIPLVLQFLFSIVNNFLGIQILVASGEQKKYSISLVITCIAIVSLNLILGKIFTIYGVAWASLISEIVLTISLLFNCKKMEKKI